MIHPSEGEDVTRFDTVWNVLNIIGIEPFMVSLSNHERLPMKTTPRIHPLRQRSSGQAAIVRQAHDSG
jgi:hypothetical protein